MLDISLEAGLVRKGFPKEGRSLSRTVKRLKLHPICKLKVSLLHFLRYLKKTQNPRSETIDFLPQSIAGHGNFVFTLMNGSSKSHRADTEGPRGALHTLQVCITLEETRVKETPIFQKRCWQTCPIFALEGDIILINLVRKQICPLPEGDTISLLKAACSTNILCSPDQMLSMPLLRRWTKTQDTHRECTSNSLNLVLEGCV